MQNNLLNGYNMTNIENGVDDKYTDGNIIYTVTTTSNQKNNNNNSTTIDLGDCEKKLKEKYNISENNNLYILKLDIYIDGYKNPKVEYEVYYPFNENNMTKLDLSYCENIKVDISIPIILSNDEIDKYNLSSDLYNDICYTLTSDNKTDKPLEDRRKEYLDNNMSLCEEDCVFEKYNETTKKAICSCLTKIKIPLISTIQFDKDKLISNFKNIKSIANFKVLKCLYLLFNTKNFFINTSNYIIIILFIISLLSIIRFIYHDNIKIENIFNEEKEEKEDGKNINKKIKKIRRKKRKKIKEDKIKKIK